MSVVQIHDFVAPVIPYEEKTEAELMVEFRHTLPVRDLVMDIDQKFHDQVSFLAVGKTPYVGFRGNVPNEVFGMIEGELPVPIIFVENTGYSETELLAQQDQLVQALGVRFDGAGFSISRSFDGNILVGVSDDSYNLGEDQVGYTGVRPESETPRQTPDVAEVQEFVDEYMRQHGVDNIVVSATYWSQIEFQSGTQSAAP